MEYFYLGLITKPFGYKGELTVFLDTDEPEKYCGILAGGRRVHPLHD